MGLGSNLGDRRANLRRALDLLREHLSIDRVSSLYETAPVGYEDQPDFLNAVCRAATGLAPGDLLALLKGIEEGMGRRAGPRYGPRLIDLDLLLYDSLILTEVDLILPHPRMSERAFVLVPLAEIAPEAVHPGLGLTAAQLLARLPVVAEVRRVEGPEWGGGQRREGRD